MTQSFGTDAKGDLTLGADGSVLILSGVAAVEAACANAAKTRLSEMVLAVDQGLPFFESVWTGAPNIPHFEASLRDALLAVDGVTEISSLTIGQAGDTLEYAAQIMTTFGPGAINGQL